MCGEIRSCSRSSLGCTMAKDTPIMRRICLVLGLLFMAGCTTPCPPKPERYTCPDELGTTWIAQDANGCSRYLCSVGGRGGFVEVP